MKYTDSLERFPTYSFLKKNLPPAPDSHLFTITVEGGPRK